MKKRLLTLLTRITSLVLMMGVALKAQAAGIVIGRLLPSPPPTSTPPPVVAQFTALADQYYKSDSSKQAVTVAGCAAASIDFSTINQTLFLNLYDNHTFALGMDDSPTDARIFTFPDSPIAVDERTILTGMWAPINSSNTKFKLYPNGDLANPIDGSLSDLWLTDGWRHMISWINKYACSSLHDRVFKGLALGSFRVITADINAKSSAMVAGTPVPVGAATLTLAFEGYERVPPNWTPTPAPTSTPTPTNLPANTIYLYGMIAGTEVLGGQLPTVTALVGGVPRVCTVFSNAYDCGLFDKPVVTNGVDDINLLVGQYTYDGDHCFNNKVVISAPLPIQSVNGTIVADGTVDETTRFQYLVGGILPAINRMRGDITFSEQNSSLADCPVVTPTATPTLDPSSTPTPTATITPFGATPSWTPTPTHNYTSTPSGATPTPSPTKRPTATSASTTTATPTPRTMDADSKVTYKLIARGAWRPTLTPAVTSTPINSLYSSLGIGAGSTIVSAASFNSGAGIFLDTQTSANLTAGQTFTLLTATGEITSSGFAIIEDNTEFSFIANVAGNSVVVTLGTNIPAPINTDTPTPEDSNTPTP